MQFLNNNGHWRKIAKRLQLWFLMAAAISTAWHSATAATIYKCKQAGGKVAFQEVPCVPSDAQSLVSQTIRVAPPKTTPVSAPDSSDPEAAENLACSETGIKVFDPTRPQNLQHPQAALNHCKKNLPSPMNGNGLCLNACVQAWVGEYQKKYIGKGQ